MGLFLLYTNAWERFPGKGRLAVPVSEEGQRASIDSCLLPAPVSSWRHTWVPGNPADMRGRSNFCSKTPEMILYGNTLHRASEMLLDWSRRANPGQLLHGGLTSQRAASARECVTAGLVPCFPPGVLGTAGTHHTPEVAQTPRARWGGWSPTGYWHWLWTGKDSRDWGLQWRGKCPRLRLPTAARPGNLCTVSERGKEKEPEEHCFKDLQRTKKGKSTLPIQGSVVVTASASESQSANRGRFGFSFLNDWTCHEGGGSRRPTDSVHFHWRTCEWKDTHHTVHTGTCANFNKARKLLEIKNKMRENTHSEMKTRSKWSCTSTTYMENPAEGVSTCFSH